MDFLSLPIFDVPASLAPYCVRDSCVPEKRETTVERKERERWDGAETFLTMLVVKRVEKRKEFIAWVLSLLKKDIRVAETCLESADPFVLGDHRRCVCSKCKLGEGCERIVERLWFCAPCSASASLSPPPPLPSSSASSSLSPSPETASSFPSSLHQKKRIVVPESLREYFAAESMMPRVPVAKEVPPRSFLTYKYDYAEISDVTKFARDLDCWRTEIAAAGFKTQETCYASADPCDKSIDSCCYACREHGGCASFRLWVWK